MATGGRSVAGDQKTRELNMKSARPIARISVLTLLIVGFLSACAPPRSASPLGGTLDVLGPNQAFVAAISNDDIPIDWVLSGNPSASALRISTLDRIPALNINAEKQSFALVRRVNASMLATPYLSWGWHVAPPKSGPHPVRIIVGLINRDAESRRPWWQIGGRDEDIVDRVITIIWNDNALGRGNIMKLKTAKGRPEAAEYIARGGPEQGGRWWVDTVDLSLIHRQIWQHDDPAKIDIKYIGVAAKPSAQASSMGVATLRLQR